MLALLVLLLPTTLTAQTIPQRLDEYLTARTKLGAFSGSVLVAHDGKVLLRKGYGYANLEHLVPNTPETRFEIASLTKAFTAFAIRDLARQEKLRVDAPMCNYFEGCPDAWKAITVAQLVHHTSGIPDEKDAQDDSAARAVDWASKQPLGFTPGSKFQYSNTGYQILGLIIQRVSGKSYEDYLRERVFTPLGMTSTAHIDRTRVQRGRASGYTHEAPLVEAVAGLELTSPHVRRAPELRHAAPQADGGLLSTVDDLLKWTATVESLTPNEPGGYAFGWYVGKRFDRDRLTHNGILPGMVSQIDLYPASKTTLIVLGNLDRARMSNIVRDLALIVFGMPYDVPRPHKITSIDATRAQRFLGSYQLADGRTMTIAHDAKNGWLEASVRDQFTAGLLPASELVYYAPMWEGTITFVEGEGGSVPALVMRQTGKDLRGERLP
jgi:CubicO group peptidase (beta-lactamase class C family)